MATPNNSSYNKLVDKLRELFELDKSDLDFGIYRIIGQRQDQIDDFLSNQLKNSVTEVLSGAESSQQAEIETALAKAEQSARDAGFEPEQAPKVKELRKKLGALDGSHRVEYEVYEHLYRFFSRYYEEGDFVSQRRVSRNARYAIPYNGEEVKLHWANADQYYIKSSENFRDYRFKLTDGRGVHFKLLDADTNRDNTKSEKRFFRLVDDTPISENGDELLIHFYYSKLDEKKITDADGKEKTPSQKLFNELALRVLSEQLPTSWTEVLHALQATNANPKRTLLEKHLNDYTTKNSFDYFIHKDLGGFLRQELDFYIKNEVMFLDDIEDVDAPNVESYLRSLKAIRRVAGKVIDFLAQLEDFQKKLWLKKKFVVQCDYCITLDRVSESYYAEIVENEAQLSEWRQLHFIEADTTIDTAYLKAHQFLFLDTKFYSVGFKLELLATFEDIDAQCSGLLVNADNFQALNILQDRYREKVKCIYIDPPYNTQNDEFPYKDGYKVSSWYSFLFDRVGISSLFLDNSALFFMQIGDDEAARSRMLVESIFTERKNTIVVRRGVKNVQAQFDDIEKLSLGHDVIHVCSIDKNLRVPHALSKLDEEKPGKWDTFWRGTDRPTMRYELLGITPDTGQWRWEKIRANVAVVNYQKYLDGVSQEKSLDEWWVENQQSGVELNFVRKNTEGVIQYYVAPQNYKLLSDNWLDISSLGTETDFPHEKNIELMKRIVSWPTALKSGLVLDYFAGSGTTGHAVVSLNREDSGDRKYILAEQGTYFDTVLKPRIQKVVYSERWKDGKPVIKDEKSDNPHNGVSHCFKYMKLESYEDTLNNLELSQRDKQQELLAQHADVQEDYLLNYMLDVEAKGSLLKIDAFNQPFEYKLHIATDSAGETRRQAVDLVETFNYLLGLRVHTQRQDTVQVSCKQDEHGVWKRALSSNIASSKPQADGSNSYTFFSIDGTLPDGKNALVVWRILNDFDEPVSKTCHNIALDYFLMERKRVNPREGELDVIYVNGDNTLPNIRAEEEHWKVRLIEEEFQRLMFAEEL